MTIRPWDRTEGNLYPEGSQILSYEPEGDGSV